MTKVLVLAAHRAPDESRINHAGVTALKSIAGVTVHELKREYPDHQIDVAREQALLLEHDAIVLMFPFWWYSSPAILKDWQDMRHTQDSLSELLEKTGVISRLG